jgi:predicted HicB family RNase H-like nuclease
MTSDTKPVRVNLELDSRLHKSLKLAAVTEGRTLREVVSEALEHHLKARQQVIAGVHRELDALIQ